MRIKVKKLELLVHQSLLKKFGQKTADLLTPVIMFGELSGKTSHGLVRLIVGKSSMLAQQPTGGPEIVKKTKVSSLIQSNQNPAMMVASVAMKEVIKLAKKNNFGIVGTNNTLSTSGCLTYYVEQIAKQDLIGIVMARSPQCIVPHGGIEPLMGTNPIAFGIPSIPHPFIFDMGTSAISYGEVLKAKTLKKNLPENVAIDQLGNPTTNPERVQGGALLSFDHSYKGAGLAMIVEIFAGILTGAGYGKIDDGGWGNFFLAFSPELLIDKEDFKHKIQDFIESVRNSKTKDGKQVRISGEKTLLTRDENLRRGEIEVDDGILNRIKSFLAGKPQNLSV